jgi:hypothetical protein
MSVKHVRLEVFKQVAQRYRRAPVLIENPISTRESETKGALYTTIKTCKKFKSVCDSEGSKTAASDNWSGDER